MAARGMSTNHALALDLLQTCRSSQNGGCQHVVNDDFIKNAFVLPWSAVCGTDLHGHRINKTLLVIQWRCQWSVFRAWPSHSMCSRPHFTGKPNWPRADFAKKLSPASRIKGNRSEQILQKTVSREEGPRNYRDFAKNRALGRHVREISEMGGQKMGSNMRPRYIRFRDIHDHDISGVHCTWLIHLPCTVAQGQSHCPSNITSNSHPFHSKWVDLPIPKIQQFQYFTLKIQGPGHGWGQNWKYVPTRYVPTRFHRNSTRTAPMKAVTGLAGQNH